MKLRIPCSVLLLAWALAGGSVTRATGAEEVPGWLRQAAAVSHPAYDKDVRAVVLLDEGRRVVDDDGKMIFTQLYAVKILAREGRSRAVARTVYLTDSEKVKEMRAWLIRPGGEVRRYGKDQTLDLAIADNDVYNEARRKLISAVEDADAGCVFGYEIVTEERSVFSQFNWGFQSNVPVLLSRLTLIMSQGWRAESMTFNHARVEPVVNGSTYVWELRDLPGIEVEPASPDDLAARMVYNIFPPAGKSTPLRTFDSWKEVSKYLSELHDPQIGYNEAMEIKARELTSGLTGEFDRIRAIGRYAQSVNYISIQLGLGRGGGYKPHSAADVFAKNYGDCKDKANMMRAMLKALKIESYPVSIFSGDPHFVRKEWPSPQQFNHCIIAVKVGDETKSASIVTHPQLGRLLVFDPTDPYTPVGDLPDHEQGSYALVMAGEKGDLVKMPLTAPEDNLVERTVDATLGADGWLVARVIETSTGHAAVSERALLRGSTRQEYEKAIGRWVTQGSSGVTVGRIEPSDDEKSGRFRIEVEFRAPSYAQSMRGRLLVFKPAVVSRRSTVPVSGESRKYPVVLESHAYIETARIKLPEGFVVDEYPEPIEINQPFGNYAMVCRPVDGYLEYKRSLSIKAMIVPPEQYPALRNFYGRILGAEQAPVVLMKK